MVNQPQTEVEVNGLDRCILRGCSCGNDDWMRRLAGLMKKRTSQSLE
jgi:hypothetical protein